MNPIWSAIVMSVMLFVCTGIVSALDEEVEHGTCQCAVFKDNKEHGPNCKPVINKTPGFEVTCDDEGHTNCLNMCKALAQAAKESAPAMLCEVVQDMAVGIQPSVFSKACETKMWTYTGLTNPYAICCSAGVQTECAVTSTTVEVETTAETTQ